MTICIIPATGATYDTKIVRDLSNSLGQIGVDAIHCNAPINDDFLSELAQSRNIDTYIRVNRFPPHPDLRRKNFRHISWFQDVFPSTNMKGIIFQRDDRVITLGDPNVLGLKVPNQVLSGHMPQYINPEDYVAYVDKAENMIFDFNLVGYIPRVIWQHPHYTDVKMKPKSAFRLLLISYLNILIKSICYGDFKKIDRRKAQRAITNLSNLIHPKKNTKVQSIEEKLFSAAFHSHDIVAGNLEIESFRRQILSQLDPNIDLSTETLDFLVRELPRYFDRVFICQKIKEVSHNLVLAGENWALYEPFSPFSVGKVNFRQTLDIFSKSKVTLQNNNHGIGIQSRTLSCMAAGGFILCHTSPRDKMQGGLRSIFQPDYHYGVFERTTICEVARYWCENSDERRKIAKRSQKYVLNNMTWKQGAKHLKKICEL